ncbi:hypothetical protein RLOatenuis_8090 [Rickettsiales bacterium]|nr:hypothetical protein RLOatenuis_8090 [Rickettsiales bacterium]
MKDWGKTYSDLLKIAETDYGNKPSNGCYNGSTQAEIPADFILIEDEKGSIEKLKTILSQYHNAVQKFKEEMKNLEETYNAVEKDDHPSSREIKEKESKDMSWLIKNNILTKIAEQTPHLLEGQQTLQNIAYSQMEHLDKTLEKGEWKELGRYCEDACKFWVLHSGLPEPIYAKHFEELHSSAVIVAGFEQTLDGLEQEKTFKNAIGKLRSIRVIEGFGALSLTQSTPAADSVQEAKGRGAKGP